MKRFHSFVVLTILIVAGCVIALIVSLSGDSTASAGIVPDITAALQQQLDASGKLEPNVLEGRQENRAFQINLPRSVTLSKPIRITNNVRLDGGWQRFALIWYGTEPPIEFGSNVGHGSTNNIALTNLTIYAPRASAAWRWDKTATGNAGNYTLAHLDITTADIKVNLQAPGDGNAYWFDVDDVNCRGPGRVVVGRPITGRLNNIRWVNQPGPGPMFDISGTATITNCWCESTGPAMRLHGKFSIVSWMGNHNEPHNVAPGTPQFVIDGEGEPCVLIADALYFTSPGLPVEVINGGILRFIGGRPTVIMEGGMNPDPRTPLSMSAWDRIADRIETGGKVSAAHDQLMDLLRRSYRVKGKGSCVQFDGGQITDPTAPPPAPR
jgi:hypothetical protein